jgi:hypothetical protein
MAAASNEIAILTIEGYEGRFVKWEGDSWRAYEYRNYRHWFSQPQRLTEIDFSKLRRAFGISTKLFADHELMRKSPEVLAQIGNDGWKSST